MLCKLTNDYSIDTLVHFSCLKGYVCLDSFLIENQLVLMTLYLHYTVISIKLIILF